MKRLFTVAFIALFCEVDSTITFYNDRDLYLAALDGANIIEATASRSRPVQASSTEHSTLLRYGDFEQCGLTFKWSGDTLTSYMQAIQIQFGEHTGARDNREQSFEGDAVYWVGIRDNAISSLATKIVTKYPFYAIGFDHAGSGSPEFGIKLPGEEIKYQEMIQVAGGANRAQFVGWISDGEPVQEFQIFASSNRFNQGIGFTNIAYATRDETAVTPVGCENKNHATRMCWATGWGDPHMVTWDGLKYDIHAKGEVVMARSMDSDFEIQARLEGLNGDNTGGPALITGIVVKDNDPEFPTLQVSMASATSATAQNFHGCLIDLYVDKQPTNIYTWAGTEDARVSVNQGAQKIIIEYMESNVRVKLKALNYRGMCYFTVDFFLADCYNDERLIGLLGSPDGNYKNDWMTPSNEVLPLPQGVSAFFFQDAYDYSVQNWCLQNADESFFAYESDKTFSSYAHCGIAYDPTLESILNDVPDVLDFCNGDIGCIMDGVELGTEAAEAYIAEPAVGKQMKYPEPVPTNPTPPSTPDGSQGSGGDPHITTWANEHYEYHGQCDLVLAKDADFADGLGLEIHIRTKVVRYWSFIKSVAIKIGNDILEIEGSADSNDAEAHYWMNFEYQGELETFAGFPVTQKLPSVYKRGYKIDLSPKYPGKYIAVELYKEFVRVRFNGDELAFGNTVGLMGDYKTGKTLARDGNTVMDDFTEFGDEWQVLPSEPKIFHEISHPQFPELCIKPEDPRGDRKRRLDESTISIKQAEAACASLKDPLSIKDCVYDIIATQDLDMVGAF